MTNSTTRRPILNSEMAQILERFARHLVCWHVGLSYGSVLNFDMGDHLIEEIKPGVTGPVGSSNLTLEGYQWTISFEGKQILNSIGVSPDLIDQKFQDFFKGKRLERIEFTHDKHELLVQFSESLIIRSPAVLSGEYVDDNLCLFLLADGRVLGCDPRFGFFDDGSKSRTHEKHYAEA